MQKNLNETFSHWHLYSDYKSRLFARYDIRKSGSSKYLSGVLNLDSHDMKSIRPAKISNSLDCKNGWFSLTSVSICDPHSFHQFSHSHFCQVEKILRNSVKSLDWKVSSPSRFSFFFTRPAIPAFLSFLVAIEHLQSRRQNLPLINANYIFSISNI